MSENFNNSLNTIFEKMDQFVSTKTVVGEPSHIGDVIIVPLIDVAFGLGVGGGGGNASAESGSGGGGGLGAKITPSAVLVINNGNVQLVNVKNQDSVNKLIDMIPGVLSKFNFGPLSKSSEKSSATESSEAKSHSDTDEDSL